MEKQISILVIGSELLDGRVADTNSHFLLSSLSAAGYIVAHTASCIDTVDAISAGLSFLLSRTDLCIISGGLGPTSDDLTTEAIARFFNRPMILDEPALERLLEYYKLKKRSFDPTNKKQAVFPEGAKIILNPVGTAAGFSLSVDAKSVMVFPGVPRELKTMFSSSGLELVSSFIGLTPKVFQSGLRVFGVPESVIGAKVEADGVPTGLTISYRAHFPEVQVLFKSSDSSLIEPFCKQAISRIGPDFVFSTDLNASLDQVVHQLLTNSGLTLAIAESCTGGMLGQLITANPGSSKYFNGGVISYSNEVKTRSLGVSVDSLTDHGAVSEVVAKEMAYGVRDALRSDIGISITGVAGPDGGTEAKPVGTFFIGLSSPDKVLGLRYFFSGSREFVRTYAAYSALDSLRRYLLKLPQREQ